MLGLAAAVCLHVMQILYNVQFIQCEYEKRRSGQKQKLLINGNGTRSKKAKNSINNNNCNNKKKKEKKNNNNSSNNNKQNDKKNKNKEENGSSNGVKQNGNGSAKVHNDKNNINGKD